MGLVNPPGGEIKSIQKGVTSISTAVSSIDVIISPVDITKSVVSFLGATTNNSIADLSYLALINSTTLRATRGGVQAGVVSAASWQIVEYK